MHISIRFSCEKTRLTGSIFDGLCDKHIVLSILERENLIELVVEGRKNTTVFFMNECVSLNELLVEIRDSALYF